MFGLVRRIAGFWDEVISLWEAKELPPDFWGGKPGSGNRVWLYRANNHRKFQEQFEIANYYRLGLDRNGTTPYASSRPRRFRIIQQQWVRWCVACRDNGIASPECTSTLAGWARELRSIRGQLPQELTTQSRVQVTLEELEAEEPPARGPAPQERAQAPLAADQELGHLPAQPAAGNGHAAHNP